MILSTEINHFEKSIPMPRNVTVIQVFVASPSDVETERDLLETLVTELNVTWSNALDVMFELVKWETHVHPSFSSDPQAVINEQIGDSYDVFIGILWGRFGTPTPRSLSGTAEEFERAYSRLKDSQHKPEIMVYFKDAPISPSRIDTNQLKLVQEFKDSLSALGGYHATFEDENGFQSSLRAHLAMLAQKFSKAKQIVGNAQSTTFTAHSESIAVEEDELGYLDYSEIYASRISDMTSTFEVITNATVRIADQMNQHTVKITQMNSTGPEVKTITRAVKLVADDMNAYAGILGQQIPLVSSSREAGFQALSRALTLYEDFSNEDKSSLTDLHSSLKYLGKNVEASVEGISDFRSTVSAMPRMTSDLNKAKRNVIKQLDSIYMEIEKTVTTVENILNSINQMLQK